MKRRFTAAATLLAAALAACSSPPAALGNHDARVSINGKATNALQPVTCTQNGPSWTIQTTNKDPGFTVNLETGDEVTAQAVDIRNMADFTGTFWNDNIGKAKAELEGGQFSVTGEANGAFADKPNQPATATFDITTSC